MPDTCLISVVLKDADFQRPCYIARIPPVSNDDSGYRFYLGYEMRQMPKMVLVDNVHDYLSCMGLTGLAGDLECGYRIDMSGSIDGYPSIRYRDRTWSFRPDGLYSYDNADYTETTRDIIYFSDMSFKDKLCISWNDRFLIDSLVGPHVHFPDVCGG